MCLVKSEGQRHRDKRHPMAPRAVMTEFIILSLSLSYYNVHDIGLRLTAQ